MATQAQFTSSSTDEPGGVTAFIDRWIYVMMALYLIVIVLVGFIPDSLMKLAALDAGMRPPFPPILHVHAVLMGCWMLLLLTQTTLMATGRRGLHMQTGVAGMILAPLLVIVGFTLAPTNYQLIAAFAEAAPPEMQAEAAGIVDFVANIALVQIRIGIVFSVMVYLALRARSRDAGLHKRLIILATIVPLPAAIDRMPFLPHSLPQSPLTIDLWPLLVIAPMFLWDLYRQRRVHSAYWIYVALMVPTGMAVNLLWFSPWWMSVAPGLLGG